MQGKYLVKSNQSIAPRPSTPTAASIASSENPRRARNAAPAPRGSGRQPARAVRLRLEGGDRRRHPIRRHPRLLEPPRDRGVPEAAAGERGGATTGEAAVVDEPGALEPARRRGALVTDEAPHARGASRGSRTLRSRARSARPARVSAACARNSRRMARARGRSTSVPTVRPTRTTTSTGSVRHSRSSSSTTTPRRVSRIAVTRATGYAGAVAASSVAACSASAAALGRKAGGHDLLGWRLVLDRREDRLRHVRMLAENAVAFWRPWPSRSSPKLKYEPDFWTSFRSSAVSRTVPSRRSRSRR